MVRGNESNVRLNGKRNQSHLGQATRSQRQQRLIAAHARDVLHYDPGTQGQSKCHDCRAKTQRGRR